MDTTSEITITRKLIRSETQYWVASLVGLAVVLVYVNLLNQADFLVFYHATQRLLEGHNPYPDPRSSFVYSGSAFVYPLWTCLLFVPISFLSPHVAEVVFAGVSYFAYVAGLRIIRGPDFISLAAVSLATPVIISLQMGTLTPFLFLGIIALWRWRSSALSAALIFALIATSKLFLLPLIGFFLVTKRFRSAALGGLFSILLLGAGFILGPISMGDYVRILASLASHETTFGWSLNGILHMTSLGTLFDQMTIVILASMTMFFILINFKSARDERFVLFGLIVVSLIATPILWSSYLPVLLAGSLILDISSQNLMVIALASWFLVTPDLARVKWDIFGFALVVAVVVFRVIDGDARAGIAKFRLSTRSFIRSARHNWSRSVYLPVAILLEGIVGLVRPGEIAAVSVQELLGLSLWFAVRQSR